MQARRARRWATNYVGLEPSTMTDDTQIGHHMLKMLAREIEQHMVPPPKHKQCQSIKKFLHAWRMKFSYVILTQSGSGHHPTPVDIIPFHPHRLPPRDS